MTIQMMLMLNIVIALSCMQHFLFTEMFKVDT